MTGAGGDQSGQHLPCLLHFGQSAIHASIGYTLEPGSSPQLPCRIMVVHAGIALIVDQVNVVGLAAVALFHPG